MTRYSSAIPVTSLGGGTRNGMPGGGGYRWRGTPGWNPSATPEADLPDRSAVRHYTKASLDRTCVRCAAPPGRRCKGPSGKWLGQPHYDRWAGEQ